MNEETTPEVVKPINPDSLLTPEEAYSVCLERERIRERDWRRTCQGGFESEMESLDTLTDSFDDPSKIGAFSDRGYGALAIERYYDGEGAVYHSVKCINRARMKVARVSKKLLEVLYLVIKNGSNKDESIWEMILKRRNSGTRRICSMNANATKSSKSSKRHRRPK